MTDDDRDGFDKEAERRKLEEKYGESGDDGTRRMSELLLKGATMTNRHCGTCGDPLFRQNGEEFCPTCNAAGDAGDGTARAANDQQATGHQQAVNDPQTANAPQAAGDATATPNDGGTPDARQDESAAETARPAGSNDVRSPANRPQATTNGRARDDSAGRPTTESQNRAGLDGAVTDERPAAEPVTGDAGDLDAARETLIAAVTRHARAGAETTDPRRAKDQFAAAREAAEALAALRR